MRQKNARGSRAREGNPGAQKGHKGKSLKHFDKPDRIVRLIINKDKLPPGKWKLVGYAIHQVVKVITRREITQYEAEIYVDDSSGQELTTPYPAEVKLPNAEDNIKVEPITGADTVVADCTVEERIVEPVTGADTIVADCTVEERIVEPVAGADPVLADRPVEERIVESKLLSGQRPIIMATFPTGAKAPIQYASSVKALSTFYNVAQFIPTNRVHEIFKDHYDLSLSSGTVYAFRAEAAHRLLDYGFVDWAKKTIIDSEVINADETGINVLGKQAWLHIAVAKDAVFGAVADSRKGEAIENIGILPSTRAVITRDHYSAYERFDQTLHALCNAHLLRELKGLEDKFGLKWPTEMAEYLRGLNKEVEAAGGMLDEARQREVKAGFLAILKKGEEECPLKPRPPGKVGRVPKSKGRHMVDRLRKEIDEVLRFMTMKAVEFTNNAAERAIRMQKVHEKISGCFRNLESANEFVLLRSYLMTCAKHGVKAYDALLTLFDGRLPSFMSRESQPAFNPSLVASPSLPIVSQAA